MYNDGDRAFGNYRDLAVGERLYIAVEGVVFARLNPSP